MLKCYQDPRSVLFLCHTDIASSREVSQVLSVVCEISAEAEINLNKQFKQTIK